MEKYLNLPFAVFWLLVIIFWISDFVNPWSALTWMGLGAATVGWLILVLAKWPQIVSGEFFKFGSEGLPPVNKRLYVVSYLAMIVATALLIFSHFTDFLLIQS
jgi:hypothetical protein